MASDGCCVHHWIIKPAEGPTSAGVCAKCSASKDFSNSVHTPSWGTGYNRGGAANRLKLPQDNADE